MFWHSLPFCSYNLICDFVCRGINHILRQFIYQINGAVIDTHLLGCCAGILLRTLSDLYPLNEDAQDLSGQLRDLAVPFGVSNEPSDIRAGVFQLLKTYFNGRELLLNLFLLDGVLPREDSIPLVRDTSKYTVLVEPFKQFCQLDLALSHGVDSLLKHINLLLHRLAPFLADMLRKP